MIVNDHDLPKPKNLIKRKGTMKTLYQQRSDDGNLVELLCYKNKEKIWYHVVRVVKTYQYGDFTIDFGVHITEYLNQKVFL